MQEERILKDNLPKVNIFSDGSAKGQGDGPGGYGVIIHYMKDGNIERKMEYTDGFKVTTNNRMELLGVITGLESLITPSEVTIYSDSKYVVDAFNHGWIESWQKNGWKTSTKLPVKNIDLWKRLLAAKEPHECKFVWVKGHDGHKENERCDYLAQCSALGIKFDRKKDGTLVESGTLKTDTGLKDSDVEVPKITMNSVMKEYVQAIAKDIKNYTIKINNAKFIFDEEGNVAPHPDEDPEKCKKVIETLKKLQADTKFGEAFRDLLFGSDGSTLLCNFSGDFFTDFFTGNKTIPSISVSKGSDK